MLQLFFACNAQSEPVGTGAADTADSAEPLVEVDWGVAATCGVDRAGTGFNDWYDTRRAVMVYGDSDEDRVLADEVYG